MRTFKLVLDLVDAPFQWTLNYETAFQGNEAIANVTEYWAREFSSFPRCKGILVFETTDGEAKPYGRCSVVVDKTFAWSDA